MQTTLAPAGLQTDRPSVFLDRWVWIRLARAARGRPREPGDTTALEAVRAAAASGVAFPLTSTYYIESLTTSDPRQRADLARTIASITHCCTLRSRRDLVGHQIRRAMHRQFGRPTFAPKAPEPLGVGVFWTFLGGQAPLKVGTPDGAIDPNSIPGLAGKLRHMAQWAEVQFLTGARDEEVEALRRRGYKPEITVDAGLDRLAWEQSFIDLLATDPVSPHELRVRLQARELVHEYMDPFVEMLAEYGLSIDRALGIDLDRPGSARPAAVAFTDDIPTLRLAVDLKYHLFRNTSIIPTTNHLYDIDALSLAIPYCHAALGDKEMSSFLRRSRTTEWTGTAILSGLGELVERLPEMSRKAADLGVLDWWGWTGPGDGFCLDLPDPVP
jgi:hypothetical protein